MKYKVIMLADMARGRKVIAEYKGLLDSEIAGEVALVLMGCTKEDGTPAFNTVEEVVALPYFKLRPHIEELNKINNPVDGVVEAKKN